MANHTEGFSRSSGVLMHITSLPGRYGIGDIGSTAHRFVDFLAEAKQTYWQVLPLGPTGFGDSPYLCFSSFAGNTRLISLDLLVDSGWLSTNELNDRPQFRERAVEYDRIISWHDEMLSLAYERFLRDGGEQDLSFKSFCELHDEHWLEDYALFAALKDFYGNIPWHQWKPGEALRAGIEMRVAKEKHTYRINEQKFRQWVFYDQWAKLKAHAANSQIRIIGDVPIYVGHDSCDVWANRNLFDLDERGYLRTQTGVPPDYFSATGQLWGHPTYLWTEHEKLDEIDQRYGWWVKRIRASLKLYDAIRIDHFRAFYNFWRVPAGAQTAQDGKWVKGPQDLFLQELEKALAADPRVDMRSVLIAEDLGDEMEKVIEWRLKWGLYGMKILQFAFGENPEEVNRFTPITLGTQGEGYDKRTAFYTGSHDNSTTIGWWYTEGRKTREQVRRMFDECVSKSGNTQDRQEYDEPNWQMIYIGMHSADDIFILPMQDLLGTGETSRMNVPGKTGGFWRWRCTEEELSQANWERLKAITISANRLQP